MRVKEEVMRSSPLRRSRRRHRASPALVQKLFDTCREIFSAVQPGALPSPADVERLRSVLDGMRPSDVGLNQNMPCFSQTTDDEKPPVIYLHLYESHHFSIGIFCLPPSAEIPLHNHPGMTVFSKLLFGSMHVKSMDWCEPGLAKIVMDSTLTAPCSASVLYPEAGGNIHRFTAVTACAVLDVLGPPYSDDHGRHCNYYTELPGDSTTEEREAEAGYVWLEEREMPEEFVVMSAKYGGPRIIIR